MSATPWDLLATPMSLNAFYNIEQLYFYRITNQHSNVPALQFHDFYYDQYLGKDKCERDSFDESGDSFITSLCESEIFGDAPERYVPSIRCYVKCSSCM